MALTCASLSCPFNEYKSPPSAYSVAIYRSTAVCTSFPPINRHCPTVLGRRNADRSCNTLECRTRRSTASSLKTSLVCLWSSSTLGTRFSATNGLTWPCAARRLSTARHTQLYDPYPSTRSSVYIGVSEADEEEGEEEGEEEEAPDVESDDSQGILHCCRPERMNE